ncbi:MAG: Fe-S cluster assembly protein SufD [Proteobacteria bacterium]|nr:Fe-S cluster assembly protein SufD [Pseudomonadota bacterium]
MNEKNQILDAYDTAFHAAAAGLPGSGTDWATSLRHDAMAGFRASGFPTRRDEAWRYTNLTPLQKRPYLAATSANEITGIERADLPRRDMDGARIVMVNGRFDETLSDLGPLDGSLTFMSLARALDEKPELVEPYLVGETGEDGIRRLNTALMADGSVIILPAGARPELPLEILYLNSAGENAAAHIRNLVVLEAGASLDLIETCRDTSGNGSAFWSNIVSTMVVGEGASLNHHQIQTIGSEALLSAAANVRVAEGGHYSNFVLTAGGLVTRNEIHILLQGRDAQATLDGLCLARAGQSLANVTIVEHQSPAASSKQRYKSILQARASAAFLGKVVVARDAQHSEAHQASDSLLLGEGATANAKPELLIHADDVKCSHGATVGALDKAALFYLNSRGLDPAAAKEVLVTAFAEEILECISLAPWRQIIRAEIAGWMRDGEKVSSQ